MGDVKIPYYRTKGGARPGTRHMGYWAPCLARPNKKSGVFEPTLMATLGFTHQELGEHGPAAWALAQSWNAKWKAALAAHRAGLPAGPVARVYPQNSAGEAFARLKRTASWRGKPVRTREDWERGWKLIDPIFGDRDPATLSLEDLDLWYAGDADDPNVQGLLQRVGVREAHRAVKIWRALWKVISTIKRDDGRTYCVRDADPSLGIRRQTPKARDKFWYEGEAVRLVKRAIRMDYGGAAAALAVAWDSMLSPVDVVSLTKAKLHRDAKGPLFSLERTKSGEKAIATLSKRATRVLEAWLATLPTDYLPGLPIFLTRGGKPGPKGGRPRPPVRYTVDRLGKDFAKIRSAEFPGDLRQLSDFRRSGALEVDAGGATRKVLATKMANSIDESAHLQDTYLPQVLPPDATVVRLADGARVLGRARLRTADRGVK